MKTTRRIRRPGLVRLLCAASAAFVSVVCIAAETFPDARVPAPGNAPRRFQLSQDYPSKPAADKDLPWLKFDVTKQPDDYLRSVLNYCVDGNEKADWVIQMNQIRKWYHAPWMHWGPSGREPIRGLTRERVAEPFELAPRQTQRFQSWAVGFYNPAGGYTLGQVWKDPNKPNAAAAVFPEGTVSCKLLFSQANVDQVPYLAGSLEWDAYIYTNTETPANPNGARSLQKLRLLQIDVAVRDKRVDSTTGWVFGTFIYNGDVAGKTVWDRMVPVGAMWGNDEGVTAADVNGGKPIKESTINHGSNLPLYSVQSPRQHLGWAGRLNGPVDNPASSCLSCHSTAQWPIASQMVPLAKDPPGSAGWMRWFRNIGPAQPFDSGCTSLDYSLQLAAGMANYYEWSAITHSRGGVDTGAMDPSAPTCTSTNAFMSTTPNHHTHKVTRDEAEELTEQ